MKTNIHFLSYLAHNFLEWEMFQTKVVEKIKTHILCSITFFFPIRLWDNVVTFSRVGLATGGSIIRLMRISYWIPKATNTHSEYVILITFPLQQWLHRRTSILPYTYIACLVTLVEVMVWTVMVRNLIGVWDRHSGEYWDHSLVRCGTI